jgi:hypothetical protein
MEKNYPPPVYPKTDPEYKKRIMEQFYKKVRETNWGYDENEYQGKPRGRKPKVTTRIETKPRTKSEEKAFTNKFFNYNK